MDCGACTKMSARNCTNCVEALIRDAEFPFDDAPARILKELRLPDEEPQFDRRRRSLGRTRPNVFFLVS